ncbi:hypothetical protein C1645_813317 [Glomus cerebriforme]|uniref:F-box domain-containing protein n=1 Tax=Glomus cerebriforme TaxID=658196 RepID=A0A397TIK7_9GLOM|nr:hypothetical protein C1645_813317 [Glomus cerebriforme]
MSQLPVDCLNDTFEYLENDMATLYSCLLVNRLWCNASMRIFWRNGYKYRSSNFLTLIACLPNESKEILYKYDIIIPTPTSKPPMFNYASFCKVLSVDQVHYQLGEILRNQQSIPFENLSMDTHILEQEIFKLFMNQIGSLKKLTFYGYSGTIIFNFYPGAKDCLKDLSELSCDSNIPSEFFYQLSQICHNILSLSINFKQDISKNITDLISAQENLKSLDISFFTHGTYGSLNNIISLLTKPNNLIKFYLYAKSHNFSLSFITRFTILKELELSFNYSNDFNDFEKLQLPQLQILRFPIASPKYELLIKFLEYNGKNLNEFYVGDNDYDINLLNLVIDEFCPNLKKFIYRDYTAN